MNHKKKLATWPALPTAEGLADFGPMADMSRKPPVNKNKTKNLPAAEKKEEENRPQTRRWQKQLLVSTRQFCGTLPPIPLGS